MANQQYLAVTGHLCHNREIKGVLLRLLHISNNSSTAQNLSNLIKTEVLDKYPDITFTCAVTDNANNMIATVGELHLKHLPCYAHSLQLVINRAILLTKDSVPDPKSISASDDSELDRLVILHYCYCIKSKRLSIFILFAVPWINMRTTMCQKKILLL